MVFDDYGRPFFRASAKQAVAEFFADKPEPAIALHTGQLLSLRFEYSGLNVRYASNLFEAEGDVDRQFNP